MSVDQLSNLIQVKVPQDEIEAFCEQWNVVELALFGSVLRNDFASDSDIDVLVTFAPESTWTLLDHVTMQDQLQEIFKREVDLVNRRAIERSHNQIRRQAILDSAEVIYVA